MRFLVTADCIGCGLCVSTCPEVFRMNAAGVAEAAAEAEGPAQGTAVEAMEGCPVDAIEKL